MMRPVYSLLAGVFLLVGCGPTVTEAPDGSSVYRLNNASQDRVQVRILDNVNALRTAQGLQEVRLDSSLNAAAESHSRDMSAQQRPWNFSSDGSSPVERVQRAGFTRTLIGENIAESFETELQVLTAWMQQSGPRDVILDRTATDLGFGYYQEPNGKIWYTMLVGGSAPGRPLSPAPPARTTPPPVQPVEPVTDPAIAEPVS